MKERWQYIDKDVPPGSVDRISLLNYMGADGWELCCEYQNVFYFKRVFNERGW